MNRWCHINHFLNDDIWRALDEMAFKSLSSWTLLVVRLLWYGSRNLILSINLIKDLSFSKQSWSLSKWTKFNNVRDYACRLDLMKVFGVKVNIIIIPYQSSHHVLQSFAFAIFSFLQIIFQGVDTLMSI